MRHQEDKPYKATSSLFLIKMLAELVLDTSNAEHYLLTKKEFAIKFNNRVLVQIGLKTVAIQVLVILRVMP